MYSQSADDPLLSPKNPKGRPTYFIHHAASYGLPRGSVIIKLGWRAFRTLRQGKITFRTMIDSSTSFHCIVMPEAASNDVAQLFRNKRRYSFLGDYTMGKDKRSIKVAFSLYFLPSQICVRSFCVYCKSLIFIIRFPHSDSVPSFPG